MPSCPVLLDLFPHIIPHSLTMSSTPIQIRQQGWLSPALIDYRRKQPDGQQTQ
jgi:hypothetical protein